MTEAMLLPGFEERSTQVRGRRIRYFAGGEGPPLVLVHGLGGAATNWSEMASLLVWRRRVLIPDLPGHGGSQALPAARDLSSFADAVASCAEREECLPFAAVGHSLGGAVALRLALRRPEAVSGLVLAAAAGISSSSLRARAMLRVLGLLRPSRLVARYRHVVAESRALKGLAFRLLAADPEALSPRAVHGFLVGSEMVTESETAARALFAEDARSDLGRLECPALVLWGARDRFIPLEDGFEYARRLGAPLRVLPDTGHLLIGERPHDCARFVEEWLGGLDGIREVDELPVEPEALGELRR